MARKKQKKSDAPTDDDKTLADLCASTEHDEISFEVWNSCHTELTLSIPLWVSAPAASQGGSLNVSFSRTVKDSEASPSVRHPASCTISLPAGVEEGAKFIVKGQGDRLGDVTGDLIVIVRLRSS